MKLIWIVCFSAFLYGVNALKCFTCSMSGEDEDQTCLTDPKEAAGSAITNCDKKYCTIIRQELKINRKLVSFLRSCEDSPKILNGADEDTTHKYYFKACTSDLCNKGNGITWGDVVNPDGEIWQNILIPGLGNNVGKIAVPVVTFVIAILTPILMILAH